MSLWPQVALAEACSKITDGTHHSPANGPVGDFKYITAKNIKPTGLDLSDLTYVDAKTHADIYSRCDVRKDDILYVKDGATTGRVALNTLSEPFSLLSSVGVLRPGPSVRPRYLLYALQERTVKDRMLSAVAGVAITRLTLKKLGAATIPLAPLDRQDTIVAEIEKQFSRLDEAVANLQRVKANLRHYVAATLTAAVNGELATGDMALGDGRTNGPRDALERVTAARRNRWPGRYREPNKYDMEGLPTLPTGWGWSSLDGLSWNSSYGTSVKCSYESEGVPVLRIPNVQRGALDLADLKFAPDSFALAGAEAVSAGDMLIIRTNGSKSLIGRAAAVCAQPPRSLAFASYLIRFRLVEYDGLPEWVSIVWQESRMRTWIESRAATSAGQHNISQSVLATAAIPLPPLAEQKRIVAEVDRRLSIVHGVEAEVDANLKRAQALRQAVLSRAFQSV